MYKNLTNKCIKDLPRNLITLDLCCTVNLNDNCIKYLPHNLTYLNICNCYRIVSIFIDVCKKILFIFFVTTYRKFYTIVSIFINLLIDKVIFIQSIT